MRSKRYYQIRSVVRFLFGLLIIGAFLAILGIVGNMETAGATESGTETSQVQTLDTTGTWDIPVERDDYSVTGPVLEDGTQLESEAEAPIQPVGEPAPAPVIPTCEEGYALAEDMSCVPNTFWDEPVDYPTYSLPACATEDSDNCYWDAARMGNGIGTSFVTLNGVTYYPR